MTVKQLITRAVVVVQRMQTGNAQFAHQCYPTRSLPWYVSLPACLAVFNHLLGLTSSTTSQLPNRFWAMKRKGSNESTERAAALCRHAI